MEGYWPLKRCFQRVWHGLIPFHCWPMLAETCCRGTYPASTPLPLSEKLIAFDRIQRNQSGWSLIPTEKKTDQCQSKCSSFRWLMEEADKQLVGLSASQRVTACHRVLSQYSALCWGLKVSGGDSSSRAQGVRGKPAPSSRDDTMLSLFARKKLGSDGCMPRYAKINIICQ